MKYLFWTACFLLLDLSISQGEENTCKVDQDCQTLSTAQPGMKCVNGFCKYPDDADGEKKSKQDSSITTTIGPKVEQNCTSNDQCETADTNAFCDMTRNQCQCKPGFSASPGDKKCLPAIELGKSGCEDDVQCQATTAYSTCEKGACTCQAGFHPMSGKCWTNTEFGSSCSHLEDCSLVGHAICNNQSRCSCPADRVVHPNFKKCLPIALKIEDECEEAIQCSELLGEGGTCMEQHCRCHEHYGYSSDWTKCVKKLGFGSTCSLPRECNLVKHATCNSQFKCSCLLGRVINGNSTECLPIAAKIEDDCVEAIQCSQLLGEGGTCMKQHCRCHEHYHYSSNLNKCVKNLDLGAACQHNDECSNGVPEGENNGPLRCLEKKCACAEDFANVEGKCKSVLRRDQLNSANRLGNVSTFALALGYFVLLSSVL